MQPSIQPEVLFIEPGFISKCAHHQPRPEPETVTAVQPFEVVYHEYEEAQRKERLRQFMAKEMQKHRQPIWTEESDAHVQAYYRNNRRRFSQRIFR